jgi:tetratricopeptide (TPR) repeat protein
LIGLISGIASGLAYAHDKMSLIHRDMKPHNILIDATEHPKVADFGISSYNAMTIKRGSISGQTWISSKTNTSLIGTPLFMAPELFDGADYSTLTDIYALGVTLYYWITGRHPYLTEQGDFSPRPSEQIAGVVMGLYEKPEYQRVANVIAACLALDPRVRIDSYAALLTLLKNSGRVLKTGTIERSAEVSNIVSSAKVLRVQGQVSEAKSLLASALKKFTANPLLMNSMAALFITQNERAEATDLLEQAVWTLRTNDGHYDGRPYLDPFLNLGNLRRDRGDFMQAYLVFKEAAERVNGPFVLWASRKEEFAWLRLFEGEFDDASNLCIIAFALVGVSVKMFSVFLLAAFISGTVDKYAARCFDKMSNDLQGDEELLPCIAVLANFLDGNRLLLLQDRVLNSRVILRLQTIGRELSGDSKIFRSR